MNGLREEAETEGSHGEEREARAEVSSLDLRRIAGEWSEDLGRVRQHVLLNEAAFIRFARDRGIQVRGVATGDPGRLHQIGWLAADGRDSRGDPLFHPFRVYPLHRILRATTIPVTSATPDEREGLPRLLEHIETRLRGTDRVGEKAEDWNAVVDLTILLEPAYWPDVSGQVKWGGWMSEDEAEAALAEYRARTLDLVKELDEPNWRKVHEHLRTYAAQTDNNASLYLLLRMAPWRRRERLKGPVSAALWFRHMGEVIRRAFEEAHNVEWHEEDRAFGQWFPGARTRIYGSERPLDAPLAAKPYLAHEFGLFTGSVVRWYVEGETEYHAVKELLPGHHLGGIELINLRGNVSEERSNIAMKLGDHLAEDRALRRFSMISFDLDVPANKKAIRRRVEQGEVVGLVFAHRPDFEFANFSLSELVEVAAQIDEQHGVSGDPVRDADWSEVDGASAFKSRYCEVSARRPRGLKGAGWGRALAAYAAEHPEVDGGEPERPLSKAIFAALQSRFASYDYHRDSFILDPDTFELVESPESGSAGSGG